MTPAQKTKIATVIIIPFNAVFLGSNLSEQHWGPAAISAAAVIIGTFVLIYLIVTERHL